MKQDVSGSVLEISTPVRWNTEACELERLAK